MNSSLILKDQEGAVIIIAALCMTVFLFILALVIDIPYLMITKNELQNIADSVALLSAREMGNQYIQGHINEAQNYEAYPEDYTYIIANQLDGKYLVGGEEIEISEEDIIPGRWSNNLLEFNEGGTVFYGPVVIKVIARKEDTLNDPVSTFIARIINEDFASVEMSAEAIAGLTAPDRISNYFIPIGISKSLWSGINRQLTFIPPNAADQRYWAFHCYHPDICDTSADLNPILQELIPPADPTDPDEWEAKLSFTIPTLLFNDDEEDRELKFFRPTIADVSSDFYDLFNAAKGIDDGWDTGAYGEIDYDDDEDSTKWTTSCVVYNDSNINDWTGSQIMPVVGVATITLQLNGSQLQATIRDLAFTRERGTGKPNTQCYGTRGMIPTLIQ
ncbi:MAG: pilus assembly protein TadG-related protein [bacterium]